MREKLNFKKAFDDIKADFRKDRIARTLTNYLLIIAGSAILAIGDAFFIIPYNIVSGGVAGFAIVMSFMAGWDTELTITIAQWVLFLIGILLLGAKFGFKTIISTIVYPIFLFLFTYIYDNNQWVHLPAISSSNGTMVSILVLAGLVGGALVGVGCGLTFLGGGSTGGVDCLSLATAKYFRIKTAVTSFVIDATIVCVYIVYMNNILLLLVGIISAFMCSFLINLTYREDQNSYVADIISDKWELINNEINYKLDRGTTLLESYGGYTGKEKMMIHVVFSKDDYDEIMKLIFKYDPDAFVFTTKAHEATGEGFRKVPYRIAREIKFSKTTPHPDVVITKKKLKTRHDTNK
ncbi:MAG: YitT family protein [Bacilli bacterium]|nr:YitT family protein [Bacilli bacterium]